MTTFDPAVIPRFLYSRSVMSSGLAYRRAGATWDRAAAACTMDGQLDTSVLKRWHRRFELVDGHLAQKLPPATPFPTLVLNAMLVAPVGSWSPDLPHEDHWARSPPRQP